MECDPTLLQSFLDQELDPVAEAAVRQHLAECPRCRRELAALKLLWMELDRAVDVPPAPELLYLRRQVLNAIKADRGPTQTDPQGSDSAGKRKTTPRSTPLSAGRAALLWLGAQSTVWKPVWAGVQYIPGARMLNRFTASGPPPGPSDIGPRKKRRRGGWTRWFTLWR